MAGIAGFGKEAQIGEFQHSYDIPTFSECRRIDVPPDCRMDEHEEKEKQSSKEPNEKNARFPF